MMCKTSYPSLRGSRYQVRRIVPATFHKLYPALWKFPNAVASNLKSQVYSVSVCGSTGHSFIEYDVSARGIHYDKAYSILSSLVVPRPIALVSTKGSDGSVNAAPYSFFNIMGIDPPLVVFGPSDQADGSPKDTLRNISESDDFVVNLVNEEILEAMNKCAVALSYGDSELSFAGLTAVPSTVVKSPRILEAPANLECKKFDILRVGRNNLVIGVVERVHIRADLLINERESRINREELHAVGRLQSPGWYCKTRDAMLLEVPPVPHR